MSANQLNMSNRRGYNRNQSRLFRIKSPAQLCDVLLISKEQLQMLLSARDNYIRWTDKETGRSIQRPKPLLEKIHKRAAVLLARIETPDFLHSAVKGRSYISNANMHDAALPTVKVDIRKFYPSTRAQEVFHFFRDRMECDGDVSGILAQLLTVDGHLATGSSASPILSYFAYENMFGEIQKLAERELCLMTCYVDDVVITGKGATRRMIREAIKIIRNYRLWGHKTKSFKYGQPKVITGVAVTRSGQRLPNKRQQQIALEMEKLKVAATDSERLVIMRRLTGKLYEATQVDPSWRNQADTAAQQQKALMRKLRSGS